MIESASVGCYIVFIAGRRSGIACIWMWKIIQRFDRIRYDFDWYFDVFFFRFVMDVVQGVDFCIILIVFGVVDNGDIFFCWLIVSIIQGFNFWRCLLAWSFVDYIDFFIFRFICFVIQRFDFWRSILFEFFFMYLYFFFIGSVMSII